MNPICWIALDVGSRAKAERIIEILPHHRHYKIGMELFYREGPALVSHLVRQGYHIFLDLKCYDIPHTVGRAAAVAANLGAEVLTVHALGGLAMLEAARAAAGAMEVVAVTVVTSLDEAAMRQLGWNQSLAQLTLKLADVARQAGVSGLVSSADEAPSLRALWPGARLIVPGIRLLGDDSHDQRRVSSPETAIRHGATDLVVGRSVIEAPDPARAYEQLRREINVNDK